MPVSIRLATRADEPAIQHVIRSAYDEYGWAWDPEGYHEDLYNIEQGYFAKNGFFWVSEANDEIIGTVGLLTFPPIIGKESQSSEGELPRVPGVDCSVERLYLLKSSRGTGIGSRLFQHVIDHATAIGCKRMEIWSDKKLVGAHAMYRKFGAKQVIERICDDPDQSPEWGMALDLN
jgi:GNAT superfamily N-acetyltransferase